MRPHLNEGSSVNSVPHKVYKYYRNEFERFLAGPCVVNEHALCWFTVHGFLCRQRSLLNTLTVPGVIQSTFEGGALTWLAGEAFTALRRWFYLMEDRLLCPELLVRSSGLTTRRVMDLLNSLAHLTSLFTIALLKAMASRRLNKVKKSSLR